MAAALNNAQKKPKFVPSRLKNKNKFYLRGELLTIRESINTGAWEKYAAEKYDLNAEPFSIVCTNSDSEEIDPSSNVDIHQASSSNDEESLQQKRPHVYSRESLFGIKDSHDEKWWKQYAGKIWNLKEEPFEMDTELRCPFEQRLRVLRERERMARKKVIEQRKQPAEITWEDVKNRFMAENMLPIEKSLSNQKNMGLTKESETINYWEQKAKEWIQKHNTEDIVDEKENISTAQDKDLSEEHDPAELFKMLKLADTKREQILEGSYYPDPLKQPFVPVVSIPEQPKGTAEKKTTKPTFSVHAPIHISSYSISEKTKIATEKKAPKPPVSVFSASSTTSSSRNRPKSLQNLFDQTAYNLKFAQITHEYITSFCFKR